MTLDDEGLALLRRCLDAWTGDGPAMPLDEIRAYLARPRQPAQASGEPVALARRFHEAYERLAPKFGYETRTETRKFDPESANGKLMIAVCAEIAAPPVDPARRERVRKLANRLVTHSYKEANALEDDLLEAAAILRDDYGLEGER